MTGTARGATRLRRLAAAATGGAFAILLALTATTAADAAPAQPAVVAAPIAATVPAATESGAPVDPATASESIAIWIRQASDRAGIPNVSVTVSGSGFSQTVVTGSDGKVSVGLPAPGSYQVSVDGATVPASAGTIPTASNPRSVQVDTGNTGVPANFLATTDAGSSSGGSSSGPSPSSSGGTGTGSQSGDDGTGATTPSATTGGTGFWGIVAALFATGLIFGLLLALAAIGASLIYGTTGLNNFAHGELVTFGGLMAYTVTSLGAPGWLGIIAAIVLGGVFGFAQDLLIWKPLRRRRVGLVPLMIVSIGLALAVRYLYVFFYGSDRLTLPNDPTPFLVLGSVSLRFTDVAGSVIAIVALGLVAFVMLRTRLGKAARAVSDNPALAAASGIDVDRVIRFVWIGAAALAGLAGVLVAYYQSLRWDTGSAILLLIFAAITLGGLGSAFGALIGSLVLGVFMNLSTLVIPENLKYAAALVVLIVILLFRPQGILGRKERVG